MQLSVSKSRKARYPPLSPPLPPNKYITPFIRTGPSYTGTPGLAEEQQQERQPEAPTPPQAALLPQDAPPLIGLMHEVQPAQAAPPPPPPAGVPALPAVAPTIGVMGEDLDEDFRPHLAEMQEVRMLPSPLEAKDPLLLHAEALLDSGIRADLAAVIALASAARQGRPPNPSAVCARDGDGPVSKSQQGSYDRFTSLDINTDLPTLAAIRKEAMAAKRVQAPCPELNGALQFLEGRNDERPRADDAQALVSRIPCLVPKQRSTAQLPERLQKPEPGKLSTIDPAGFLETHAEHCGKCQKDKPCPIVALAEWVGALTLPFLPGRPLPQDLHPTPRDQPFDPDMATLAKALISEGTLERSDDVLNYAKMQLANRTTIKLTPEEELQIVKDGSPAALRIASQKASLFLEAFFKALGDDASPSSTPAAQSGPLGPPPRAPQGQ